MSRQKETENVAVDETESDKRPASKTSPRPTIIGVDMKNSGLKKRKYFHAWNMIIATINWIFNQCIVSTSVLKSKGACEILLYNAIAILNIIIITMIVLIFITTNK